MASTTKSTVLLKHHLKQLKLPTMLAECEKIAVRAAKDNLDHLAFLLQLCELELIDRERRAGEHVEADALVEAGAERVGGVDGRGDQHREDARHDDESDPADQPTDRAQRQQDAQEGGHPLAPLEAQPDGVAMPQKCSQTSKLRGILPADHPCQQHRHRDLAARRPQQGRAQAAPTRHRLGLLGLLGLFNIRRQRRSES